MEWKPESEPHAIISGMMGQKGVSLPAIMGTLHDVNAGTLMELKPKSRDKPPTTRPATRSHALR